MLSLFYTFKRLIRDRGLLRKMSLLFGASGDQVDSAVDAISPIVIGRLADLPETDLAPLLDHADPSILSSASDFLERDTEQSEALVSQLFGSDRRNLVSEISRISGVGTSTVGSLLPRLTSMMVAYLRKYREDSKTDTAAIRSRIVAERDEFRETENGRALLDLIPPTDGGSGISKGGIAGGAAAAGAAAATVFGAGSGEDQLNERAESARAAKPLDQKSASAQPASSARALANSGSTTRPVATPAKRDREFGFLWWLLGLLGGLVVLGLLVSQCGGDDDDGDQANVADTNESEGDSGATPATVTTTASASATTEPPPATTAPPPPETTEPPQTTVAPAPETTLPPATTVAPEPELELGSAITEGILLGGFTVSNSTKIDGADPQPLGEPQSSVTSTGVEFGTFGPFAIDVAADSITMEWNDDPQFDELEGEIPAGSSELYSFTFDDPVFAGATATVDPTQSLIPAATIADDNNLVIEFGEGTAFGDDGVAIVHVKIGTGGDGGTAEDSTMAELPMTGLESKHLALVATMLVLVGMAMVRSSNQQLDRASEA